jgi:hypothetical protein
MTPLATMPSEPFDARAAVNRLVKRVALAVIATAVCLGALLFLVNKPDWWQGYIAATLASALAAGLSILPLALGMKRGFSGVMVGFLASSGLRFLVTIGVAALAVGVGDYPTVPTFLLILPFYAVTLTIEVWSLTDLQAKS